MTVNGNLVVLGNTTAVESQTLSIWDNTITLNGNVTGTPVLDAIIQVDRGTSANTAIRWHESVKSWQVTNDGTNYGNVLFSLNGNLNLTSNLVLPQLTTAPSPITGNTTVFAVAPGNGGTGLYVANSNYANVEIITKQRSIAYSIVFG
jgi:hypothetical protein